MLKLCIGDYLRIARALPEEIWTWGYRLVDFSTGTPIIVVSANNFSSLGSSTFEITEAIFGSYIGKELLLEIFNGETGVVTERDFLLISGVYNKFEQTKKLLRLLGHNIKKVAENATDWQDGHLKNQVMTTYTSNSLLVEAENYEWSQSFVQDFTPDYRYFTQKILQKEASV